MSQVVNSLLQRSGFACGMDSGSLIIALLRWRWVDSLLQVQMTACGKAAKSGDRGGPQADYGACGCEPADNDGSPALLGSLCIRSEMTKALTLRCKAGQSRITRRTPPLQASRTGDAAIMDTLLKAGVDPSLAHPEGETPLMAALVPACGCGPPVPAQSRCERRDKFQEETGQHVGRPRRPRRSRVGIARRRS